MSVNIALSGTFVFLLMLFSGAGYVFGAYALFRIGRKFGIGTFEDYCIPIYNYVLLCRCAEISPWLLLWLLVPLADIGFVVYLWGTLAKRLGHNFWSYGLGFFPFGIPALVLAFDGSKPAAKEHTVAVTLPPIYCISGESIDWVTFSVSAQSVQRNSTTAWLRSRSDPTAHAGVRRDGCGRRR